MKTETQRKSPRAKTAPDEIVYLNFQSGNGAIVLDVSSEGLGFQAADPLEPNESLTFRLSVPAFPDIGLSGRVAWLDATRKRGGLRLDGPAAALPSFKQWRSKYIDSLPEIAEVPPPEPPSAPIPQASEPTPPPQPETHRSEPPHQAPASAFQPRLGSQGPLFISEWGAPPDDSHSGRNLLIVGVILALCLLVAGSYYFGGKRQIGDVLIRLGESIGGQGPQPSAQTTAALNSSEAKAPVQNPSSAATPENTARAPLPSNASPQNPSANVAPLASPGQSQRPLANVPSPSQHPSLGANAGGSASLTSPPQSTRISNPAAASSAPSQSSHAAAAGAPAPSAAVTPANSGAADLAQAQKYLQDSNPADSAIAASLLWSAIQAGNTKAELILADLYLRGQGAVQQNCAQAEALLSAAQSANVPGAAEKLQELQTYGCR